MGIYVGGLREPREPARVLSQYYVARTAAIPLALVLMMLAEIKISGLRIHVLAT